MLPVEVEPVGPAPAGFGDEDEEVVVGLHAVQSLSDLAHGAAAAENRLCKVFPSPGSHVQRLGSAS